MRSSRPTAGNPWPHDMVISIEDSANTLLPLLWIREAWHLEPEGDDLPPRLIDTPIPVPETVRASAPIASWTDAWPELWRAGLRHAGDSPRARVLADQGGSTWMDKFGPDALDHGESEWVAALIEQRLLPLVEKDPERAALDVLVPAWQAGLTTIVQLPCRGAFTRMIGPHALAVTIETRSDPTRYRDAIGAFH